MAGTLTTGCYSVAVYRVESVRMLQAFTNGRIESMDVSAQTEVVLVTNGRIEGVGGVDLLGGRADVEVIDLGGRRLLPGFMDAHHHLSVSALHALWADLLDVDALEVARERFLDVARVSDAPGYAAATGTAARSA